MVSKIRTEHDITLLVNELVVEARTHAASQQLRERIAHRLVPHLQEFLAAQRNHEVIAKCVEKELDGIDRCETDDNGWWETSTGANWGGHKLHAIKALFERWRLK